MKEKKLKKAGERKRIEERDKEHEKLISLRIDKNFKNKLISSSKINILKRLGINE
jgi:hypothetical protein